MSRKDFELIASVLNDLQSSIPRESHMTIVHRFADALESTNPRFLHNRFIEACCKEDS